VGCFSVWGQKGKKQRVPFSVMLCVVAGKKVVSIRLPQMCSVSCSSPCFALGVTLIRLGEMDRPYRFSS